MLTSIYKYIVILLLGLSFLVGNLSLAQVGNSADLKSSIDKKAEELKKINDQILENQKKLEETQGQKKTLSSEIKIIDSSIKQISLGIDSSKVAIEKLSLEVDSISNNISDAEIDIANKEAALAEILRQLQKNDTENLLFVILKNSKLSDSLSDLQALSDVNSTLIVKIKEVNDAKTNMEDLLKKKETTKSSKEIEKINLENRKLIAKDIKEQKNKFLDETKSKEKVYAESLKQLEERQLQIALEIEKMESQLRSQINYKNLPKNLPGILMRPTAGPLTQDYGATKFAQRAYKGKWHNGLDFGGGIGAPIYAAEDGIVLGVDNQDLYCRKGAYGKYVVIKHYMGLTTLYGHMSMYIVSQGDQVKKGQIIGYVGSTGYATGPHLHFTVYDSSTFKFNQSASCGRMPVGGDLNPRNYISI